MADVTIRIEALDLTQSAVRSAMDALRRLTSEARRDDASRVIKDSFKAMGTASANFTRQSLADLRRRAREHSETIRFMERAEARFQLRILNANSKSQRDLARLRQQRTRVVRLELQRETKEIEREVRNREKTIGEIERGYAKHRRDLKRQEAQELRERERRALQYIRNNEREQRTAERAEQQRVQRRRALYEGFFSRLRSFGFNTIFAGSLTGSQASLIGSGAGSALTSIGSTLRSGFTDLNQILPKTVRLLTQVASTAARVAGGVASLYVGLVGNLLGSVATLVPKVGILLAGITVGATNLLSGLMRALTDSIAGAVELAGGLLEGLVNTVTSLASKAISIVSDTLGGILGAVSSVLGKVGEVAGEVFGKLVGEGVDALTSNFKEIASFRSALTDVFVQTPEIGAEKFELIKNTIEDIAKKLPLAKVDLAKGLFEIVSTQLTKTPEEALQVLQGVSKATVAGGHETDVFSVSQAATGVLSAYNLEASKTEEVLSKMFKTAILGRFNFKQLSDGIQAASGIAANFDVELNDLLATFVLASKSLRPREVFVGVKNLILALAAPTFEAKKQMDALGISLKTLTDEEQEGINVREQRIAQMEATVVALERLDKKTHRQTLALKDLRKALTAAKDEYQSYQRSVGTFIGLQPAVQKISDLGLSPEETRKIVPERRALAAFAAIVSAQDRASEAIDTIVNETGQAVEEGLKLQTGTLENTLQITLNNFKALFDGLYDIAEPAFIDVLGLVTQNLAAIGSKFEGLYAEFGDTGTDVIRKVLTDITDRVFSAVNWIIDNWSRIRDGAAEVFQAVLIIAKATINVANLIGDAIIKGFGGEQNFVDSIKTAWTSMSDFVKGVWEGINQIAQGNLEPIYGLIDGLRIVWARLLDFMRASLSDLLGGLQGPLNSFITQARDLAISAQHPIDTALGIKPSEAASARVSARSSFIATGATASRYATAALVPGGPAARGEFAPSAFGGGIVRGGPQTDTEKAIADSFVKMTNEILTNLQNNPKGGGSLVRRLTESDVRDYLFGAVAEAFQRTGRGDEVPSLGAAGPYSGLVQNDFLEQIFGNKLDGLIKQFQDTGDQFGVMVTQLTRYGIEGKDAQDAFANENIIDLSGVIQSLNKSTEDSVRAQIATERALRALNDSISALASEGVTTRSSGAAAATALAGVVGGAGAGVLLPPNPAGKKQEEQRSVEALDTLEGIEENTAEALESQQQGDPFFDGGDDSPFIGKAPKLGKYKDPKDLANVDSILQEAVEAIDDTRPEKVKEKKERKAKSVVLSKQDITRARKAYNRAKLARSGLTFGSAFGIGGPAGVTVGKPILDEDGNIKGFQDGPSAFTGVIHSNRAEEARKATLQRIKENNERRRQQREAYKKALEVAPTDQVTGADTALGQASGVIGPTDAKGNPVAPAAAGSEEAAKQAEATKKAVEDAADKQAEAIEKLDDALVALEEEQNDSTKNILDFSEEQVKALEEVGINTSELGNMVVQGTDRVTNVVQTLVKKINDLKTQQEDRLRRLEAAASEL